MSGLVAALIGAWLAAVVWLIREHDWTPAGLRERRRLELAGRIARLEQDTDQLRLEAERRDTKRREEQLESLAYERQYARYIAAHDHRPDAGDEIRMRAAAQYAAQRLLTGDSVITD